MRSAWIKWARAVEHGRALARETREFVATSPHDYPRADNTSDFSDPLLKMHWKLKIRKEFPEHWSVQIGDVLTNLRAALDHTFWALAEAHSGTPSQPHLLEFPILRDQAKFQRRAATLAPLVPAAIWDIIERVQPHHGGNDAHIDPLEILRWLSNVDKHRFVHVLGRTVVDMGPALVTSSVPLEVVEDWRNDGPVEDNDVVARLKLKRPIGDGVTVDITPIFAYAPTLQVSDQPAAEYRSLAGVMDVMKDRVLEILFACAYTMGWDRPDGDDLTLGAEHEEVSPELGGSVLFHHDHLGQVTHIPLDTDLPETA